MRLHKRTKALRFPPIAARRIAERDNGCIFCQMAYHMPDKDDFGLRILDIMHIVPKSQGGLGVEQNGVCGCRYHHQLLDNGSKGLRQEMLGQIEEYMEVLYPNWNKENLYFKKGC